MQTVGEKLSEARQRQGARIQDAADSTHVRSDYLEALENNQFDLIPLADVYKRGFIRIYARYLRLDAARLLNDYAQAVKGSAGSASSGLQSGVVGRDDPDDGGGKGILNADAGEVTSGTFPSPVQHGVRRSNGSGYWAWVVGIISVVIVGGLAWALLFSPSSARKRADATNAVRPDLPPYRWKIITYKDTAVTVVQGEGKKKILNNKMILAKNLRGEEGFAQGSLQVFGEPDVSNVQIFVEGRGYTSKEPYAKSFVVDSDSAMTGIPDKPAPTPPAKRR
jgi:hypothetical protein